MKDAHWYVRVKGHSNWFLRIDDRHLGPDGLSATMQEKILRSQVCKVHDRRDVMGPMHRLILAATREVNYAATAARYGTLLVRPSGSYMLLQGNEITEERLDLDFPIDKYGSIVICENDEKPERYWVRYLRERFPEQVIVTINYFDLRSDYDIFRYFDNADIITFSTTFSSYDWFRRLTEHQMGKKLIGQCHVESAWANALKINQTVERVDEFSKETMARLDLLPKQTIVQ